MELVFARGVKYSCGPKVAYFFLGDLPPKKVKSLLGDTSTYIYR